MAEKACRQRQVTGFLHQVTYHLRLVTRLWRKETAPAGKKPGLQREVTHHLRKVTGHLRQGACHLPCGTGGFPQEPCHLRQKSRHLPPHRGAAAGNRKVGRHDGHSRRDYLKTGLAVTVRRKFFPPTSPHPAVMA